MSSPHRRYQTGTNADSPFASHLPAAYLSPDRAHGDRKSGLGARQEGHRTMSTSRDLEAAIESHGQFTSLPTKAAR